MPAEIEKFFNAIFNLAVPIFFVYSGYLFAYKNKMDKKDKLIKYSKHIVKLYILWSLIYLPICIQIYFENGWSIQECLHNYSEGFFKLGQHPYSWQLWYLWSLIFISIVLYIFELLKLGDKVEILICFILFLLFSGKSTSSEVYVNRIMYGNCAGIGYFAAGMLLRKIGLVTRSNKYCCCCCFLGGSKHVSINILCVWITFAIMECWEDYDCSFPYSFVIKYSHDKNWKWIFLMA